MKYIDIIVLLHQIILVWNTLEEFSTIAAGGFPERNNKRKLASIGTPSYGGEAATAATAQHRSAHACVTAHELVRPAS